MPETSTAPVAPIKPAHAPLPACAVLIMSCDAYSDLWAPFFNLFWRYWQDCPWPVYLGTNHSQFGDERVISLAAGEREWSERLRICLQQIEANYVLLLLEDYFLDRPVSTRRICEKLSTLTSLGGAQMRLFPLPGPDRKIDSQPGVGMIGRRAQYRVSTQAAIWNRTHLMEMLRDGETIWNFEWNATDRSRSSNAEYYATYKPLLHYRQVIERGEWFRSAARDFGREQIGCNFTVRPVMSRSTAFKRWITTTARYCGLRLSGRLRLAR